MTLHFGDCELDPGRMELLRGGRPVHVEPQVFDLLMLLAERAGRLVSKDELVAQVWKGLAVSDATIAARISAARSAVGDDGKRQAVIRTVPRRGVMMVAEVAGQAEPDRAGAVPPPADRPPPVRYAASADGAAIAWAESGRGPPLIRISHWLSHLERDWRSPVWQPLIARLSAGHRLIRYDQRGTGHSDRDAALDGLDRFVADLEAVADAAGAPEFAMFAASQAVPVAIAFAAAHPERVTRLVLYGGYAEGRLFRPHGEGEMDEATVLSLIRAGWGRRGSAFLKAFSTLFMPDATPDQVDDMARMQLETATPETAMALRMTIDRFRVTGLLGGVQAPTLVLHAENDAIQPVGQGRRLAAGIPGARFVPLAGGNHVPLPQTEAWAEMIEAVEAFLADV